MRYDFRVKTAKAPVINALYRYEDVDADTVFYMPVKHWPVRNPITGLTVRHGKPVKVTLAEVAHELKAPGPSVKPEPAAGVDLAQQVLAKAIEIGGGTRRRVRIADLARAMPHVPLKQLHNTLVLLQSTDKIVLYRIDDPSDITPADEAAAMNIAGFPRHILYVQ